MSDKYPIVKCKWCGTKYEEGDECPKCAEDWKTEMSCDECHKSLGAYESHGHTSDDYLRFTIRSEVGMWEDWDYLDIYGQFCSLECLYQWLGKHLQKKKGGK